MMRKLALRILLLTAMTLSLASCQRSREEFWEDAKTAKHHMGRSFRSLFGQGDEDSRQLSSYQDFAGPSDYDFIPLNDSDLIDDLSASTVPQSKESPGETGSAIPSIDGFANPNTMQEKEVFQRVHFRYNDFAVDSEENLTIIRKIAAFMKEHPNLYVFVEGHCDERGSAAYNLALGSRRSNSVRTLLIREGVNLDHLFTVSYGKEKPLVKEGGEQAWQQNRRAQFRVFYR